MSALRSPDGDPTRRRNQVPSLARSREPGMAERFQRGLRNLLNTPPQHRTTPMPKPKERGASKGRAHRNNTAC